MVALASGKESSIARRRQQCLTGCCKNSSICYCPGGDPASCHTPTPRKVLSLSAHRALHGGLSGAGAMVINVVAFMWVRTVMAVQQLHGTPLVPTIKSLYHEGGIRRFYRGLAPALLMAPAARFGDTAANAAVFTVYNSYPQTGDLPVALKTATASFLASLFRIVLMP